MKIKLIFCLGMGLCAANFTVFAQSDPFRDSAYYVVIGAFKWESHAKNWVKTATASKFQPVSALNKNRNLYYVYVMRTENRLGAIEEATKIRKDTTYWDTWVYKGKFGIDEKGNTHLDIKPLPGQADGGKNSITATATVVPPAKVSEATGTVQTPTATPDSSVKKPDTSGVADLTAAEPGAKLFLFKIISAENQAELAGKVDVIDVDRAKKSGSYPGNKTVAVNPPNKSGNASLTCQLFGYRPSTRSLNFFAPSDSGNVVITEQLITVPFELMRLQKGDFAVMYNVYFFKDAAIMRPESKYEVNSLVSMMNENPKYKIRIHGHTNGSASGKVISTGDSKNFFSLNDSKEGYGSAKKLSEERAKMMRAFLVNQGIDMKRMEIKAWGGKKPVYDKLSPQAQANVRVEIEILEDK